MNESYLLNCKQASNLIEIDISKTTTEEEENFLKASIFMGTSRNYV